MSRWDAIVIGAGPAGAVTAYGLARGGASVLLLDRQRFPRTKVCGACLSPGTLESLSGVGLGDLPRRCGARRLDHLTLVSGSRRARLPLRGSMALARAVFDMALVDAAVAQGATFQDSTRARIGAVDRGRRRVSATRNQASAAHEASIVIDATGLGSGLALPESEASADARSRLEVSPGARIGLGATFDDPTYDVAPGELRMVVGRTGYVGLVRVEDGTLNIGAAVDRAALAGRRPEDAVAEILRDAGEQPLSGRLADDWRGTPALTRQRADLTGERLLRLGDAAGYVEPFTGEGMCWAIASGVSASNLVLESSLRWAPRIERFWRRYHFGQLARSRRLCRALAWGLRRPRLVTAAVALLAHAPQLGAPFVRRAASRPRPHPALAP